MKKLTEAQKKNIGDWALLGIFAVFILGMTGMRIYADAQLVSNKNVIVENSDNKLVVRDVNTNEERIVEISKPDHAKYSYSGDTIVIKDYPEWYAKKKVFSDKSDNVNFNDDSIWARQQREKFNIAKQSMLAKQR